MNINEQPRNSVIGKFDLLKVANMFVAARLRVRANFYAGVNAAFLLICLQRRGMQILKSSVRLSNYFRDCLTIFSDFF